MVQPSPPVNYRPMSLAHHSATDVAQLIYESAPELFTVMFGPWAIACLGEFIQRSHNRFSHQYIRVATIDQQVVGMVVLVPTTALMETSDFPDVLNGGQRLWLTLMQRLLLRHLVQQVYPSGAFYISNLAVATEYRNQGIGRQLLSHCIAAAAIASSPLFISVDVENARAQRLYESLGFQVVAEKTLRLFGVSIGSRSLAIAVPSSAE